MPSAGPRFSVLLPTHNRAETIGFAIRSLLAQSEQRFEVLVVGDGCTDGTADVVQSFADPRIRWFDLPKAPHYGYANRNITLREARGELVAFMAHDDIVLPDHLALLGDPFTDDSVEWAYSRPLWVADDGTIVPFAVDLRQPDQLAVFLDDHNSIPASCIVYRRSCHERYGLWPEDVSSAADWAYWKRIVGPSGGANLAYLPTPTALHFRAVWKTDHEWGPPPLALWLEAAQRVQWPTPLSVEVSDGELPQAALWEALEADPGGWARRVRSSVASAMDTLAWTDGQALSALRSSLGPDPVGRVNDAEHERRSAEARVQSAESRAQAAESRAEAAESRAEAAESRAEAAESRAQAAESNAGRAHQRAAELERDAADAGRRTAEAEAALEQALATAVARRGRLGGTLATVIRRARLAVRGNPLFDSEWYAATYGDVSPAAAYRHWRDHGLRDGRDPSADFSVDRYLSRNPDVQASGINPLDHYYLFGRLEGRRAGR